ncbi:YoaK family protein [Ancylobacter terrae]|uniref:YoaK family protein n=1 Tax=Ancylobacter sp. sgz301288 TaxID=3342077 RepID=UPI00385F3A14
MHFALAILVTTLAGFVDAIGYAALGKLYLSFMSGNTTRLGMAIAEGETSVVLLAASIIASFVAGAGVGTLVADATGEGRLSAILGSEAVLIALALALTVAAPGPHALLPIAAAMGMQNSAHQVVLKADIGKSFVTGTLVSFAGALARAIRDRKPTGEASTYGAAWLAFVTGVLTGALWLHHNGMVTALATALALIAALALAVHPRIVKLP